MSLDPKEDAAMFAFAISAIGGAICFIIAIVLDCCP